ncbi:MAG: hypothetical protein ABI898_09295 [Sphingomonadales bacterium]
MISFQLMLFVILWTCLMAVPVKLGLLPKIAAKLASFNRQFLKLAAIIHAQLLPRRSREKHLRKVDFDARLYGILADMADPPWMPTDDAELRLRPAAHAETKRLNLNLRILALGGYASDVLRTFRKLLTYADTKRFDDALEEIYALRGRVSAYHGYVEFQMNPFPLFDPPIAVVATQLDCGLDDRFLKQLDCLSSIDPANKLDGLETVTDICNAWMAEHGARVTQFESHIERLTQKMSTKF